jgi:hypothetical protein
VTKNGAITPVGPHPTAYEVVGRYVHSYDPSHVPARSAYQSQIPSMRPAQDLINGYSTTPIYDALYSEYLRSFRALPGDRSGEENLGFTAFGTGMQARGGYGARYTERASYPGSWQRDPNQPARHLPAALPPGPRRSV